MKSAKMEFKCEIIPEKWIEKKSGITFVSLKSMYHICSDVIPDTKPDAFNKACSCKLHDVCFFSS